MNDARSRVCVSLTADQHAVRDALAELTEALGAAGLPDAAIGTAELVLAEVLNNVVEHALSGLSQGRIEVTLRIGDGTTIAKVWDDGHPMPGHALPTGDCPDTQADINELPEGGFGWFLIQSLAQDIRYTRQPDGNLLTFTLSNDMAQDYP